MKIYWWDCGLHLKPESLADSAALSKLAESFSELGVGTYERVKPDLEQSGLQKLTEALFELGDGGLVKGIVVGHGAKMVDNEQPVGAGFKEA